jgi:hypothetical protein
MMYFTAHTGILGQILNLPDIEVNVTKDIINESHKNHVNNKVHICFSTTLPQFLAEA